jgi:hypothetical protein
MNLAPNGKPSNLTAEQYRLVRTSAFKKWFGDWENSPETASKVVDENGEPMVVYHGTDYDFNTFEKNINEKDYGYFGVGFYFTKDKNLAMSYGSKIIELFLNSKNTYIYTGKNDSIELKFGQKLGVIPKIDEDGDVIEEEYDFGNSHWFTKRYAAVLSLRIKKLGWDGVIVKEIDEIVVYNSNQIKLADGTNTTFDSNNPDIRYKEGGATKTYRNKFNIKHGFDKNKSHSLAEISKLSKLKLSSLQDIYNKGIGAYKTNPQSVRPNVKSKEQWAMARVYSAIMGGKAAKVDANELSKGKMEKGGATKAFTYTIGGL